MTPELAKAALVFLARATLHGHEAPAFALVNNALQELANQKPEPPVKAATAKRGP